jgi:hypothetical protein
MAQADAGLLNHVVAEGSTHQECQKIDWWIAQQGKSWRATGEINTKEKLLPQIQTVGDAPDPAERLRFQDSSL